MFYSGGGGREKGGYRYIDIIFWTYILYQYTYSPYSPRKMNNWTISLTQEEAETLVQLTQNITAFASGDPELFVQQCTDCVPFIPQRVLDDLHLFVDNGTESGFLLIQNPIPSEWLPPTPPDNTYLISEKTVLGKMQAILLCAISNLIAYEPEGFGFLFQDMLPIYVNTTTDGLGRNADNEVHTEQAFSDLRPDIFSLACLRADISSSMFTLPVSKVIEHTSTDDLPLLWQPLWYINADMSFEMNGQPFVEGNVRGPYPILTGTAENPFLRFDQGLMFGTDASSNDIIPKIVDTYYQYRYEYILQPNEIMIVDNRRAIHGKYPYSPSYEGNDRYYSRCFSVFDYEKSAYARSDIYTRMVLAIYS